MKTARQVQKFFIEFDNETVYRDETVYAKTKGEEGEYRLQVRTMDLNDELGQISHIFSDKTGTLTSNYMDFRKLCVNGVSYGLGTTQIGLVRRRRLGENTTVLERLMDDIKGRQRAVPHVNFMDGSDSNPGSTLAGDQQGRSGPYQATELHYFMLQLVLNHTIVLETIRDENDVVVGTQLSASSPDEEAFVNAAESFGYKFVNRAKDMVTLRIAVGNRGVQNYRVVCMLPYTQMRKMMSLIVENMQPTAGEPRYLLFSKGADSTIMSKLDRSSVSDTLSSSAWEARETMIERTDGILRDWAEDGLRTLVFAYKPLSDNELQAFLAKYNDVLSDLMERQKKEAKKPNKIDDVMAEMESGLLLQGATANEDKLQEEVPETIALLAEAGIKIYMLTGDKQETAINIGFATQMLTNEFEQFLFTFEAFEHSEEVVSAVHALSEAGETDFKKLVKRKEEVIRGILRAELERKAADLRDMKAKGLIPQSPMALIMDEMTLGEWLSSDDCAPLSGMCVCVCVQTWCSATR
jgi:phospholipid-transporting ATPase